MPAFDFLGKTDAYRKCPNGAYEFKLHQNNHASFVGYLDLVFKDRRRGKIHDLGDRIMRSYYERSGSFSLGERKFARHFFSSDFSCVCETQSYFFSLFQTDVPSPFREDVSEGSYKELLRSLGLLGRRAHEDLRRQNRFLGYKSGFDLEDSKKNLDNFVRLVRLATEFPENYNDIVFLENQMNEAVGEEDYAGAAVFRDQINELTRFVHPDFPRVLKAESV